MEKDNNAFGSTQSKVDTVIILTYIWLSYLYFATVKWNKAVFLVFLGYQLFEYVS